MDFVELVDETGFRSQVEELERSAPLLADLEIAVGIKRLAALAGVGQTRLT